MAASPVAVIPEELITMTVISLVDSVYVGLMWSVELAADARQDTMAFQTAEVSFTYHILSSAA